MEETVTRHIILVVSSDDERLQGWHRVVRRTGHNPLPAPTIRRAVFLANKVRPSLVLTDPALPDGYAHLLLRELRAIAGTGHVVIVVLGVLLLEHHQYVAQDRHAQVWPVHDDDALERLLKEHLSAA